MKTVKVVSFMHAVIEHEKNTVVIQASSVNAFCIKMHEQDVDCVLDMRGFSGLSALYPRDMIVTPTELKVEPTTRLKAALSEASRFDDNRPNDKEIYNVWKTITK
jgi:hypothetical protein